MIIPTGYAQINLRYSGLDAPLGAENVFGVVVQDFESPAETGARVKLALISSGWKGLFSASLSQDFMLIKHGPNDTGPSALIVGVGVGTNGSQSEAPGVAALAHKNTGLGGRKGRGRLFIPGVPGSATVQTGQLTSGALTLYQGVLDDLIPDLATEGADMVLLHGDATTPTTVTSMTIDGTTATQRRRLRR